MRFFHGLAVGTLCTACQPLPAPAFNVTTATWISAGKVCQVTTAGVSIHQAVRMGLGNNHALWAEVVRERTEALRSAASGNLQL